MPVYKRLSNPTHHPVTTFCFHRSSIRTICLLIITLSFIGLLYFSYQDSQDLPISSLNIKSILGHRLLEQEYLKILHENGEVLFVVEPYLLTQMVGSVEDLEEFKWQFSLPMEYEWRRNSLTVGVFEENVEKIKIQSYTRLHRFFGLSSPFEDHKKPKSTAHLIYTLHTDTSRPPLQLHIVIFRRIKHFFWLDALSPDTQFNLTDDANFGRFNSMVLHYGRTEQIFDPFNVTMLDGLTVPDDVMHFLSQLPTSRYLHCDQKKLEWFAKSNLSINVNKIRVSDEAIVNFKAFMRHMRMQFWLACGTLLGWHRQCHITPYTTDTDFATFSKYLQGENLSDRFKKIGAKYNLKLYLIFGEPTHTQEFSFLSQPGNEKVDLFFIYPNRTHFLLPFHVNPYYSYSYYPKYQLCSAELLGYKILVPCDPELIVETEYGKNWSNPVSTWDYSSAPHNIQPLMPYPFKNAQMVAL